MFTSKKPQQNDKDLSSTQEVFSKKQKEKIIQRIFVDKEIDSSFLYTGNGGEYYDAVLHSGQYQAYQDELDILEKNHPILWNYLGEYLTDIGCGNGEKVIRLLEGYHHDIKYIASDYSASMVELAEKNIKEQLPNISLGNHQIMRAGNELFTSNLQKNTYLWLGCTIGNIDRYEIIRQLKNMNNKGILEGNAIMFTYFNIPQNDEEIKKTIGLYDNDTTRKFVDNGLLNLGLDTSYFNNFVEYNKENNYLYIGVQATKDFIIPRERGDICIKTGDKFYIHQSKRFNHKEITDILKEAGAKEQEHISENGISLIVAKKNPKYYRQALKIVGVTSLLLAGVLGGSIGFKISEYNQTKKQEANNQKILKETLSGKHTKNIYVDAQQGIHEATDAMYRDFLQIYGPGKETDEKTLIMIKNLMNQYFLVADSNGVLINLDAVYGPYLIPELLHKSLKEFIAKYGWFMTKSGFSLTPQPKMQEYTSACEYTQELEGNVIADYYESTDGGLTLYIESDSTKYQKEFDDFIAELHKKNGFIDPNTSPPKHTFNSKRYGTYLHSNGKNYDILIVWGYDNKKFFLAYERQEGENYFDARQIHVYTKANGELVAKDFLENWKMVSE